jgi:ferredoxin
MKIVVDFDRCEANAICMKVQPDVFHVDENDMLDILNEHPTAAQLPGVKEAVRRCPKQALSLVED